ncbi:MAG: phosphopentomutase [Sphingomonadales bacterium]|jgi:phosphopentomutase
MRAIYIVLDSLGVGGAPDAPAYGDEGSNTLGHIALACARGEADVEGLRSGPLDIPNLKRLGLGYALDLASGVDVLKNGAAPQGLATACAETSKGKDTPSGHFEMTGVPVMFDWMVFPKTVPAFPEWLTQRLIKDAGLPGLLGDCHASGTEIIARLGDEHIATGKPIVYTSADSVLQIAAHEEHFGLERLYELCELARSYPELEAMGRVIARPFVGNGRDEPYKRTYNRRDFAQPCPDENLLDKAVAADLPVIAIGKVGDIFAHRGVSKVVKAGGNPAITDALIKAMQEEQGPCVIFANLVDFDSEFGHRRNVPGYAKAIEDFDKRLPEIEAALRDGDIAVLTADHGNDPTWEGTDHTREQVPAVFFGPGVKAGVAEGRKSFADIGQSFAGYLNLTPLKHGTSIF